MDVTGKKNLFKTLRKKMIISNYQFDKLIKQYADALNEIDRLKQENDSLKCKLNNMEQDNVIFFESNINYMANAFMYSESDDESDDESDVINEYMSDADSDIDNY